MSSLLSTRRLPARPSMILASAALHGLLLTLCAVYSLWLLESTPRPIEPTVTSVKLTDYSPGPPRMEKLSSQLSFDDAPQADTIKELEVAPESQEPERQTVQAKTVKTRSTEAIPLRKSRRQPKKMEEPKNEQSPAQKPKLAKPKENPDTYLQNRIARLREERKKMKPASQTVFANDSGAPRSRQAGGQWDEELVKWFRDVRSRVNAHWSVLGEEGPVSRVTVIGVRIGDDGELIEAKVDASSGNETFDLSAMRAIRQAAPFPSMPDRLREEIRRAGGLALRFSPGGMQ